MARSRIPGLLAPQRKCHSILLFFLAVPHEWSAPAQARSKANVGQSVGPLLRISSTSVPRKASVVGHLSSGSERTSSSPSASPKSSLSRSHKAFVAWHLGNSYSLAMQAKEAFHTRRLTLPSNGLAPATRAWPSFHSGPSPRCLREPLMSNVRRLGARSAKEAARLERIALIGLAQVQPLALTQSFRCLASWQQLQSGNASQRSVQHRDA